jgi:hypothetical protein
MSEFPETGRLVSHVILDAVVASSIDGAEAVDPTNLALERLGDIDGAVIVSDAVDGEATIDVTNLAGPSIVMVRILAEWLAEARGESIEDVVSQVREFMDL